MVVERQLDLFEPLAASIALRDTPYNSTAHALAELVDNSIDAQAREIDILILNDREYTSAGQNVRFVSGLGVMDNGHGMSREILQRSLVFGGRPPEGGMISRKIGKYGVGLVTSSLSQGERVDIWSWQEGTDSAWHCWLDIDEVRRGMLGVPEPDKQPLPPLWVRHARELICTSPNGTLVTWSRLDRVDWRTDRTTMERVEEEVGRIYRNPISRFDRSIGMRSFDMDGVSQPFKEIRANDPMYLTAGTSGHSLKDGKPMFQQWGEPYARRVVFKGKECTIEVNYSLVVKDVLAAEGATAAGNTDHGKHAGRNIGISVMREDRELMTLPVLNAVGDPRNRWWGCEIRFTQDTDDLFGVDHSKQLAARLQAVHRSWQRTPFQGRNRAENEEEQSARAEGDERRIILYELIKEIDRNTREMMTEIRAMRARSEDPVPGPGPDDPPYVPEVEDVAGDEATRNVESAIEGGSTQQNQSEQDYQIHPQENMKAWLAGDLAEDGMDPEEAMRFAAWAIAKGVKFTVRHGAINGSSLFDVRNDHSVVRIVLNQAHPFWQVLRKASGVEPDLAIDGDEPTQEEDEEIGGRDMLLAVYVLFCAWGRMVEDTRYSQRRNELANIVFDWGREAELMLAGISRRLLPETE